MIKFDNFSKIGIFNFGSNFKFKYTKEAIKVKKFSAAARLAAAAHASACEKASRFEKKGVIRGKIKNFNFWDVFLILEHERA